MKTRQRNDHFEKVQGTFSNLQRQTGVESIFASRRISDSRVVRIHASGEDSLGVVDLSQVERSFATGGFIGPACHCGNQIESITEGGANGKQHL